jgi:hypothetical protein
MERTLFPALMLLCTALLADLAPADGGRELPGGPRYRLHDFVVGAWLGPDGTDAEVRVYAECGFNVVMVGRYMAHGEYARPADVSRELDLAQRHHLWAMVDTYTQNDKPWGGVVPADRGPGHHSASLAELEWLHARVGSHPALAGYMLGDDQGQMSEQLIETTGFLSDHAPDLIPWVCGWVQARDLADHGNPFVNWQIYPTLYSTGDTAEVQCRMYCDSFENLRTQCEQTGTVPWPMVNADGADVSDSTLRFPLYSALAYGAQGVWYFTYRNSCTTYPEQTPGHDTYEAALAATTPLYPVAKETNWRLRRWGPELLGRVSSARFATGWPIESAPPPSAEGLVTAMSDDLLVGVLTRPGQAPLAMVVSKRVSKERGASPSRRVAVTFAEAVSGVTVLADGGERSTSGRQVALTLAGGEGALLRLSSTRNDRAELARLAGTAR